MEKPICDKLRAAIYVRVSREDQSEGDKTLSKTREQDCRKLEEDYGMEVVSIIRDIQRYEHKGKTYDPAGRHRYRHSSRRRLR